MVYLRSPQQVVNEFKVFLSSGGRAGRLYHFTGFLKYQIHFPKRNEALVNFKHIRHSAYQLI